MASFFPPPGASPGGSSSSSAALPPLPNLPTSPDQTQPGQAGGAGDPLAAIMSGIAPIKASVDQINMACRNIVTSGVIPGAEQICAQILSLSSSLLPMAAQSLLQPVGGAAGGGMGMGMGAPQPGPGGMAGGPQAPPPPGPQQLMG